MECEACPVRVGVCRGLTHRPACRDVAAGMPGRAEQLVALAAHEAGLTRPGPLKMAGSLARAAVAHVADGMRHATPGEQDRRKAICLACPLHDAAVDRCTKCGCGLPLKRSWASSSCPDDPPRWEAEAT